MHLSLLLTAALSQGAADLAHLHPVDADLYFEVSDPAALVTAMRAAALLDTFRDPEVVGFIGELSGMGTYDLDETLDEMWVSEFPETYRTILSGVEGASVSLRMGAAEPDFLFVSSFENEALASAASDEVLSSTGSEAILEEGWQGAFSVQEAGAPEAWLLRRGKHLILGSTALRNEEMLARLAGSARSVANHAMFARADTALGEASVPTLVRGFFRRSPLSMAAELLMLTPDAPVDELGMVADLNLMSGAHYFRMGSKEGRYVTEIFSPSSTSTESARGALGVAPIDPALAASIPTGMLAGYATTIDPALLGAHAREGLELLAAQMGEPDLLASLEGELGFPIERLFSHLGTQMTLQAQAIKGLGLPETAIWVDLVDVEAFAADLAVIAEKLPSLFEGFEARSRDYKVKNNEGERVPYPITSLSLPDGMIELPIPITIQPSVTIANGRLLMGLSSTHVKRELKRLLGQEPPDPAATNPWKQSGFEIPADARSAVFVDWGMQISGLVSLAKALGPMAGDQLPIDLSIVPDGETFAQHFRPTVHFQVERENGTYRYHEASFGPETWLSPVLAIAQRTSSTEIPPPVEAFPAEPDEDIDDGVFGTELALMQVSTAIAVYEIDTQGALPDSLDVLLDPSTAYPQGYLSGGRIPKDGWGNELVYAKGDESGFSLYSKGPNGLDEGGGGDDVSVE